MMIQNKLMSLTEVNGLVAQNRVMVLAGDESVLSKVHSGNWIGGTIPYFMDVTGGTFNKDMIFVNDLTSVITDFKICEYSTQELPELPNHRYESGFTYVLLPCFSEILQRYAIDVVHYNGIFDKPIVGWVTGIDLAESGVKVPTVFNGKTLGTHTNKVVAIHVQLPVSQYARIDILNLFEQGDGDVLTFPTDGFNQNNCLINGVESNIAEYLKSINHDVRLPLVADYAGANINISIQSMDTKSVLFYAPLRSHVEYKLAKPVGDYVKAFNALIPKESTHSIVMCNCILNYLYSELQGKKTAELTGPFTFGEIAYVLVNQTMVYLSVENN